MPSKIEWTQETWNPVTGCTKVSAGCQSCYAERMAQRLATNPQLAHIYNDGKPPFAVRCHPDRLDQPLQWKAPRTIFVCSMGDLFHEDVPRWFVWQVLATMKRCPQHTFQVLTKRPERMADFATEAVLQDRLPNVLWGVSVESQDTMWRMDAPGYTLRSMRTFVSCEPLLGPLDIFGWLLHCATDWVIVGAESGPNRRQCRVEWVRDIRDQCRATDVPLFVKQLHDDDRRLLKRADDGSWPDAWPEDLRIQEVPR